jgi:hypothetical protein
MSLIDKESLGELVVPPGVDMAPHIPPVAAGDDRDMWEIMGYNSLEDMDAAFFPDEAVDEIVRAQQQRTRSTESVTIRRVRIERAQPIGVAALVAIMRTAAAREEALLAGVEAGRVYLFTENYQ